MTNDGHTSLNANPHDRSGECTCLPRPGLWLGIGAKLKDEPLSSQTVSGAARVTSEAHS
jgi:hypothetical protein